MEPGACWFAVVLSETSCESPQLSPHLPPCTVRKERFLPRGIFAFLMVSSLEMVNSVLVAGAKGICVVVTITEEDFP